MGEEYVMYILINNELKMQKGKIAAQACHSACNVTRILERQRPKDTRYNKWIKTGEAKIVLKSTYQEMVDLIEQYEIDLKIKRYSSELWCAYTRDFGCTQVPKDSLTCIAFCPVLKRLAPKQLRKMKLL